MHCVELVVSVFGWQSSVILNPVVTVTGTKGEVSGMSERNQSNGTLTLENFGGKLTPFRFIVLQDLPNCFPNIETLFHI